VLARPQSFEEAFGVTPPHREDGLHLTSDPSNVLVYTGTCLVLNLGGQGGKLMSKKRMKAAIAATLAISHLRAGDLG